MSKELHLLPQPNLLFIAVKSNEMEIDTDINLFLQKTLSDSPAQIDENSHYKIIRLAQNEATEEKIDSFITQVDSLQKDQYSHALLLTHGKVEPIEIDGVKKGNRFDENESHHAINLTALSQRRNHPIIGPSLIDQIEYLSQEKGIRNFHIDSCHAGSLVHDLHRHQSYEALRGVNRPLAKQHQSTQLS